MKTPTMKKVIAETCFNDSQASLFRAVMRQRGADWSDVWEYPMDYRDASGGVSGFIYYTETEKFAKRNFMKIVTVLHDFEEELGEPLGKDVSNRLNWYAWFALEHIINKVMCYKEQN